MKPKPYTLQDLFQAKRERRARLSLLPIDQKIELIEGRMFWTDEQRLNMLALLLENVGMDAAVRLGDPSLWKQAIDERLKAQEGEG